MSFDFNKAFTVQSGVIRPDKCHLSGSGTLTLSGKDFMYTATYANHSHYAPFWDKAVLFRAGDSLVGRSGDRRIVIAPLAVQDDTTVAIHVYVSPRPQGGGGSQPDDGSATGTGGR